MGNPPITPNERRILAAIRQQVQEIPFETAAPPWVHWKHYGVQPPPAQYVGPDDYLQVNIYTTATTSGLTLSCRYLLPDGGMQYQTEDLDGADESTWTPMVFKTTESFLLGLCVSNLNGGLDDDVCFVSVGLQRGPEVGNVVHTLLAQGYVSNLYCIDWPPVYVRGPATGGSSGLVFPNWQGIEGVAPTLDDLSMPNAWNQQSTFSSANASAGAVIMDTESAGGDHHEGIYGDYPAAPFTLTAVFGGQSLGEATYGGLAVLASPTGAGIAAAGIPTGNPYLWVLSFTTPDGEDTSLDNAAGFEAGILGTRLVDDGTNISFLFSTDGLMWTPIYSQSRTASPFSSDGPANLALVLNPYGGSADLQVLAWNITYP